MGVTGLWKLIESSGKPVPVETLENKVLAIDISIWLHQVVKGFQDGKGGNLPNAHLLGLFHRLCKLLYYRVKPVFIFDGGVPQLKRDTIAKRSQNRQKLQSEADRIQDLILQNLVRDKVVQKALGQEVCESLISPSKQKAVPEKPHKDEMFKLPSVSGDVQDEVCPNTSSYSDSTSDADSSYEEKNLRHSYQINLQAIDVTSDSFKNLPADVRHEILTDIKEMRKQSSWGRLHELPPAALDFSGFQMKRLLKRRQVQVSLEEAEQQMEGKSLTLTELETLMSEEGILQASKANAAKRIASDESTRFLLVKDLKKAVEKAQTESKEGVKKEEIKDENAETVGDLGGEYELQLQKAIEMSLNTTQVYKDDDYEEEGGVKLNEVQRKELKTAVSSLARGYMLEYGGMNDDDIRDLIHDGNNELNNDDELQSSFNFKHNDRFVLKGEICTPYKSMPAIKEKVEKASKATKEDEIQYISSSSDESDLEEVVEAENITKKSLEIVVDTTKGACAENDDLFADIFQSSEVSTTVVESPEKPDEVKLICKTTKESTDLTNEQTEHGTKSNNDSDSAAKNIETQTLSVQSKSVVAATSPANILQKLKDEINNVQSITLEAIQIDKNSLGVALENSDNANSLDTNSIDLAIERIDQEVKKTGNETGETNPQQDGVTNDISADKTDFVASSESSVVVSKEANISEENVVPSVADSIEYEQDVKSPKSVQILTPVETHSTKSNMSPSNLDEILESVKKQTSEVVNIRLDDINPSENKAFLIHDSDDSDVEIISSSKSVSPKSRPDRIENASLATNAEIIEIADDEVKTPSKGQSSIDNFFESKFTIKKTPEKSEKEESPPPQVVSPFCVNKLSPVGRSGEKRRSPITEDGPSHGSKVAKQLFESPIKLDELESDMKSLEPTESSADVVEEAAKILREKKSKSELENIAGDIRKENRALEAERNRQNRMGTSITEKMAGECKELLRLFGIPYIVAPMEAEAQCAFLDTINLTDGTITDDSDVWLFGGRTVYKNFFNQKKHVLEFRMESIEKLFNMDRHKLIQLAMLVGSDYTTGVNGIGAVTAIEILAHFPITPMREGETTEIMSILSSLRKFRDWWQCSKTVNISGRNALRSKLKNVDLYEGFPNMNIVEAYLRPTIDDNRGQFAWGDPDIETIREFAKTKFGWTRSKTDDILQPVIKKLGERKTQASIKDYFAVKSASTVRDLKVSKRVMNAIDKMSGDYVETPTKKPKEQKSRKKKANKKEETINLVEEGAEIEGGKNEKAVKPKKKAGTRKRSGRIDEAEVVDVIESESVTQQAAQSIAVPKKKRAPILPDPNRPIPQREKDKEEMELKKKKAIEIFKSKKKVIK